MNLGRTRFILYPGYDLVHQSGPPTRRRARNAVSPAACKFNTMNASTKYSDVFGSFYTRHAFVL